ncbi:MAG: trehalose-phosphatase [Dehalococcoidia bacterium]|nr:MAG: trehalose-phosphatase [Dehalococcoidia bacterium]
MSTGGPQTLLQNWLESNRYEFSKSMQYVFNVWNDICRRIRQSKHRLLLCDYDGTLTPIVDSPEMANLTDEMRKLLAGLVHKPGVTVAIVSGRALADIKERVGISGVIYAGNHGFEIEGPEIRFIHPLTEEISSIIHLVGTVLNRAMSRVKGVTVEDKGMTLSVHYRLVDDDQLPQVNAAFENTVGTARKLGKIKTTSGKKVHEVRPAIPWHKGNAVQLIFDRISHSRKKGEVLPIYLGDDLTDEDAFKSVNELNGISVLVGEATQTSAAGYYLNSTSEVNTLLAEFLKIA